MHKEYPYLQDSFIYQTDVEREKRTLLNEIDSFLNQRQYVKITLLNWNEEPIRAIEGEISSGSISKVGDSPIRRTAQLTCAVDARSYSVDDGKADFAINKKVFIEIGVKNETPHYPEHPIFWFPEGVFFIGSFSINSGSNSSTNITLSLKDKMAMLNGDVGGTLPATTIFDSMDTQLPNGEYIEKKVLIYNIIKELVNHYGGEDLNRIVIEGVPLRIRRIMQWNGDQPIYRHEKSGTQEDGQWFPDIYEFSFSKKTDNDQTYYKGDDIGYIMDDFVILDELTGAPGETVTSILDKIKNILGNYEYYYDVFGTFHFREIKNYYVTTQARTLLDEMAENDYLVETNNSRSIYTFDDEKLLTSINVTPQYENIKNDYIVEGQTNITDSDITIPIRYHLAIDKKPEILGQDDRPNVREKINNDEKIKELQEKLKNLSARQKLDERTLETLLFNIRNAKNYIDSKQDLLDVKDKELLKQLQDYFGTTYTYEDLSTDDSKLLSEQWLHFFKPNFVVNENITIWDNYEAIILPNRQNMLYLTKLSFQPDDNLSHQMQINLSQNIQDNNLLKLPATKDISFFSWNNDTMANFLATMQDETLIKLQNTISNLEKQKSDIQDQRKRQNFVDIIDAQPGATEKEKIYNWDPTNVNINETLYTTQKESRKILDAQLSDLDAQIKINQETLNQNTARFYSFQNNVLNLYSFIVELKNQIADKLIILDGNSGKLLGIENNHECLISNINNLTWFSHNIEKITDFKKQNNTYTFISNNITLTKDIDVKNNYNFYENSLFGLFFNAFNEYYKNSDTSILKQINDLQKQIEELKNNNNVFIKPSNINQGKNYYGIYPRESVNNITVEEMILYTHPRNNLLCAAYVEKVINLPDVGNFNLIYKQDSQYYYWDGQMYQMITPLEIYDNSDKQNQYYAYDWRTKLYLDGLKGIINGTDKGYYFTELSAFWPQIYNLRTQKFYKEEEDSSIDYKTLAVAGSYYLDFLDEVNTSFGEWSVNNIGRRSDIIVKEEINCLFQPEIPNVILLPANNIDLQNIGKNISDETYRYGSSLESNLTLEQLREEARVNFYPYTQVSSDIYNNLLTGGYRNGAFDQIKYELYLHTRYQKSVSLTSIPVFYLEPNNRITINDTTTNTYGDFVIQSINLTLGPGANMSITCNETLERF